MENIIKIENLTKVFMNKTYKHTALDDINLEIYKGEIFGIIGLSGAGKSTLVRMMNYLEKPTSGSVYFENKKLGNLNEKDLRNIRKDIGMIFQSFNLLEQKTVFKNVRFPLEIAKVSKDIADKRVYELLELVDIKDKANVYPSKLSGGQKQRVAIARALATNPKVILCDEATSALDPKTTTQILSLLKKINKELGVTIVIITHQMNVIENVCDRVAIIDNAKIVEFGNVKEIFRTPKSEIGKKLIFGASDSGNSHFVKPDGKRCIRFAFDGNTTSEPIISEMVLETGFPVNILFANTREIDGKPFGQLIIELPNDKKIQDNMIEFLTKKNVTFWEVE